MEFYRDEAGVIYQGDVLEVLRTLPARSVHTCVTSPPYYALRDYGIAPSRWEATSFIPMAGLPSVEIAEWEGCLGLEPNPWMFVGHIVQVFREVRRVLRNDGTLWVNFADSYAAGGRGGGGSFMDERRDGAWKGRSSVTGWRSAPAGLKRKDLIGIPWRIAFALQADGWFLRSDIVWQKPNPMPGSYKDRPTSSHEYIFLLSKKARYYYNFQSIMEPCKESSLKRLSQDIDRQHGSEHPAKANGPMKATAFGGSKAEGYKKTTCSGKSWNPKMAGGAKGIEGRKHGFYILVNKRDVWTVATTGTQEAHFATFPPELVEPCILAGCPEGGTALDLFSGSGTTGKVAMAKGRKYILIEIKPQYCALSVKLINEWKQDPEKMQIGMKIEEA